MKATLRKVLWCFPLTLAVIELPACTSIFEGQSVQVRAVENGPASNSGQHDPLYESAKTAINARDYARALDYLHEARSRDPGDVQVLNALGVVYDKLGRFDLSARYYSQASAADPNSRIVSANIVYSKVLQGLLNPGSPMALASAQVIPGNSIVVPLEIQPVEAQRTRPAAFAAMLPRDLHPVEKQSLTIPAVPPVAAATAVPRSAIAILPEKKKVLTIGHPIQIMNASGRADGIGSISHGLATLGWTIRPSETGRVQSLSMLFYPPQNAFVAHAMQHTLPFPVRLTQDVADAAGIRLVVGSDYLSWKPKKTHVAPLWQGGAVVASASRTAQEGVR